MSYPTLFTTPGVRAFAEEIDTERQRQLQKFGEQHHPDGTGLPGDRLRAENAREVCQSMARRGETTWRGILAEEVGEAFAETEPALLRAELLQIAAVCQAWFWDLDSRTATPAAEQPEACGKCRTPFEPRDLAFDGHARHGDTEFCRRCVDACHESTDAFHQCAVCQ